MSTPLLRVVRPPDAHGYRFGPFTLEIRAGELRREGVKVRLRKQSVQILLILLEHPGEVVLREEIRSRLWPDNTVVEFDHGINTAIQRLREVLEDSAGEPRYIETLAGRGYRFVASVELMEATRPDATPDASVTTEAARSSEARPTTEPSPRRRILRIAALAALALIAAGGWLRSLIWRPAPANWILPLAGIDRPVLSPDGTAILFRNPGGLLYRRLDSTSAINIFSASRLSDVPAWSPDSTQALFHTEAGLMRMPVPGGPPVNLWPVDRITRGYSWAPDGHILVAVLSQETGGLFLISPAGGPPARLEIPGFRNGEFYKPEFLPAGNQFLFTFVPADDTEPGIYLATLKNGKMDAPPSLLRHNSAAGHFMPAGAAKLLYVQNDVLYAQSLNLQRGALEGEPRAIIQNVYSEIQTREAYFSLSRTGTLIWKPGTANPLQLTWFDRSGNAIGTAGQRSDPSAVYLSPDEKHLLLTVSDRFAGILDPDQSTYIKLPGIVRGVWTPDNQHIVYSPRAGGRLMERDLALGTDRLVAQTPGILKPIAISPDGRIAICDSEHGTYSVRLDGSPVEALPIIAVPLERGATRASFSPDGRWLVYSKHDPSTNQAEVFVKPFAFPGLRKQISSKGGRAPVWRGDGKEILFLSGTKVTSVRVAVHGNEISASAPEPLFNVRLPPTLIGDSVPLAVVRDGSRILFTQYVEDSSPVASYIATRWDLLPLPLRITANEPKQ